jgi:predicted 3-demethylubiquinone-9 3-methyltransferase (glyoxalase superfamily)
MKDHFTLCLWFDDKAEDAAKFYTSLLKIPKLKISAGTEKKDLKSMARQKGQ